MGGSCSLTSREASTTIDDDNTVTRPSESRGGLKSRDKFIRDICSAVRTTHIIITNKRSNNNVKSLECYVDKATSLLEDLTTVEIYSCFKKLATYTTSHYDSERVVLNEVQKKLYRRVILGPNSSLRHYMMKKIKSFRHAFQLSQFKRFMNSTLPPEVLNFEKREYGTSLKTPNRAQRDILAYITLKSKAYFRRFKLPKTKVMGCTLKACLEGKSNFLHTIGEQTLPTTLQELEHYKKHVDEISADLVSRSLNNNTTVRYVQVQEPMKVRSLTAMPAHHQILKGYQRALKKFLDRDPTFSLTNNPDILAAVKKMRWPNSLHFTSGDYSAATDTIFRSVVLAATSGIRCSKEERELLESGFNNFTIVDSDGEFMVNQKNGQLMGSILSFVFLCLINKWIYEYTQEMSNEVSTSPLINGDDILFKSTERFHKEWREIIQLVGFRPSPGKNFLQKSNFTINSRPFSFNKGLYTQLPFINGKEFHTYDDLTEYITALKKNTIKSNVKQNLHFCRDLNLKLKVSNRTKQQTLYMHKDSSPELGGLGFQIDDKFTKIKKAYQRVFIKKNILHEFSPPDNVSTYLDREGYPTLFNKRRGLNLKNIKKDLMGEIRNLSVIEQILLTYNRKAPIDRIAWMQKKISPIHQIYELCGHIFKKM
jgi:hypothetical protein